MEIFSFSSLSKIDLQYFKPIPSTNSQMSKEVILMQSAIKESHNLVTENTQV